MPPAGSRIDVTPSNGEPVHELPIDASQNANSAGARNSTFNSARGTDAGTAGGSGGTAAGAFSVPVAAIGVAGAGAATLARLARMVRSR